MKLYGLKHKKDGILGISISSNGDDADFCNETSVHLQKFYVGGVIYLATMEDVKKTLNEDIKWYNSTSSTPCLSDYKIKDLMIFAVDIPEGFDKV